MCNRMRRLRRVADGPRHTSARGAQCGERAPRVGGHVRTLARSLREGSRMAAHVRGSPPAPPRLDQGRLGAVLRRVGACGGRTEVPRRPSHTSPREPAPRRRQAPRDPPPAVQPRPPQQLEAAARHLRRLHERAGRTLQPTRQAVVLRLGRHCGQRLHR